MGVELCRDSTLPRALCTSVRAVISAPSSPAKSFSPSTPTGIPPFRLAPSGSLSLSLSFPRERIYRTFTPLHSPVDALAQTSRSIPLLFRSAASTARRESQNGDERFFARLSFDLSAFTIFRLSSNTFLDIPLTPHRSSGATVLSSR